MRHMLASRGVLAAGVVLTAGVAGWVFAGPPSDAAAITPPGCPASYPLGVSGAGRTPRPGDKVQLVPVGPVSVGPISVRVCGYGSATGAPDSSIVLDPVRTAALAALLDPLTDPQTAPRMPVPSADPRQLAACVPGPQPALLLFRYKVGAPLTVSVPGGSCAAVTTVTRTELGRRDVVRRVAQLLHP